MKTLAIVSGGLDSVTLAHLLAHEGHDLALLAVDYGQRHRKELDYARACAARLGVRCDVLDLRGLAPLLAGSSALTTPGVDVPHGHYAAESMRATVVPNRNAIMLNAAVGVAIAQGRESVATGVHAGDHAVYPDCRPAFIAALNEMVAVANEGFDPPTIVAPFMDHTKAHIARFAGNLGVPIAQTWSCYEGGPVHCGRCSTCVERREALAIAGVPDATPYADPHYWQKVVREYTW